jgi:hypothetical protein
MITRFNLKRFPTQTARFVAAVIAFTSGNYSLLADEMPARGLVGLEPTLAKFEPPTGQVYHGASLSQTWNSKGLSQEMLQFREAAGKDVSFVTWFAGVYENGRISSWKGNYASTLARVHSLGAASLIKFSTQDYSYNQTRKAAELKRISQGMFDSYFEEFAGTVKDFGAPVFISIDHEMNGNWYPYSQAYPGSQSTAADYITAWRHVVDIFRQKGVRNVAWVWSPSVTDVGGVAASAYYPGNDYVDWIGVSFYSSNKVTALDTLYRAYSQNKPFFITEWATNIDKSRFNPGYTSNAAWVKQFFEALETRYGRVKAISWFQWDMADGNYLLQRDLKQQAIYARHIKKDRYVGKSDQLVKPISAGTK